MCETEEVTTRMLQASQEDPTLQRQLAALSSVVVRHIGGCTAETWIVSKGGESRSGPKVNASPGPHNHHSLTFPTHPSVAKHSLQSTVSKACSRQEQLSPCAHSTVIPKREEVNQRLTPQWEELDLQDLET